MASLVVCPNCFRRKLLVEKKRRLAIGWRILKARCKGCNATMPTEGRPKIRKKRTAADILHQAKRYLQIGAKMASLVVHLKNKPSKLDWFAIGVTGLDAALEVWEEIQDERLGSAYNYFDEGGKWTKLPYHLIQIVFPMVTSVRIEKEMYDSRAAFIGSIGDVELGWVGKKDSGDSTPLNVFYEKQKKSVLQKEMSKRVWDSFSSQHVCFNAKGLSEDVAVAEHTLETGFIHNLEARISRFMDLGLSRGYLLEGLPGTGKTTAIRYLVQKMKLRSLRIDLAAFDDVATKEQFMGFAPSIELLLRVLRPDVVIIDDVDRISEDTQPHLLSLLELMHQTCKIILVSVNSKEAMLTPLLRPDRLDEHIGVGPLDREVVLNIIGHEFSDLAERMASWPIIYLVEFRRRVDALGGDQARLEIESLEERIRYAEEENETVATIGGEGYENEL